MYLYGEYLDRQLIEGVAKLDSEIKSFSVAKMEEVLAFEKRLQEANNRMEQSASVAAIFEVLERSTINTVMIDTLDIVRNDDLTYTLTAAVRTDSFDSTISQRGEFQRDQTLGDIEILDVDADALAEGEGGEENLPLVTFKTVLEVSIAAVPYEPASNSAAVPPLTNPQTTLEGEGEVSMVEGEIPEVNEDQL
jgi:hypothetical protein